MSVGHARAGRRAACARPGRAQRAAQPARGAAPSRCERDQLRGEGLGRGHADLRAGVRVERARRPRAWMRADARCRSRCAAAPRALASRSAASVSAVSPDCVMAIARVRRADDRVAVAELAAVVDLDRDARRAARSGTCRPAPACQQVPQASRPRRFARRRSASAAPELLEVDLARSRDRDAAEQRVAHGPRLLVDLLEHEVLVAALLRLHRVPGDPLRSARTTARPSKSVKRTLVGGQRRDLAVVEEDDSRACGRGARGCRRRRSSRPRRGR